jgi:hypothetical protein
VNGSHVHQELVERICAATGSSDAGVDIVRDPLDGTLWVRMSSRTATNETLKALDAHGVGAHDVNDHRIRVTGWDMRLMQWRLGALLAGVDDLRAERDATAELVRYQHDRRVAVGVEPEPWAILSDVETAMRSCVPSPHRAPHGTDLDTVLRAGRGRRGGLPATHRRAHRVRRERPERAHDGAASGGGGVSDRLKFGGMGGTPLGTGGGLRCAWLWAI